jgi:uncharacterized protein
VGADQPQAGEQGVEGTRHEFNSRGSYIAPLQVRGIAISHIIIDGYNVIGILHKDMEKARDILIDALVGYRQMGDHEITVVFDGYRNGMPTQKVSYKGNVKVIFSRLGERADDVIKKTVSQEHREWIVVTADRDIVDHVWAADSVPVPPERFMDIITKRLRIKNADVQAVQGKDQVYGKYVVQAGDEEDDQHNRKGNPYRPSRKEKAVRRVLAKL